MSIPPQWKKIIHHEEQQPYFIKLQKNIQQQRDNGESIFPDESDVFNAFNYADLPDVKVVILGQDPYHGTGNDNIPQAHGLAFSVQGDIKTPPSLVNMYKELATDIDGFITPNHGNLAPWAKQGVMLLNTVLTVKQANAHSHAKLGWETFTDNIIDQLNEHNSGCVFMLWGSHAQKKGKNIDTNKHLVLSGPHPSPLSAYRGFFGCKHFSTANTWLQDKDHKAIDWRLTNT
jgi:uracil-DNA glycosylase